MQIIVNKNSKQWEMGVSNKSTSTRACSCFAHTENVIGKIAKMADNEALSNQLFLK